MMSDLEYSMQAARMGWNWEMPAFGLSKLKVLVDTRSGGRC